MSAPPGWYPTEKSDRGAFRYWNGSKWTNEFRDTRPKSPKVLVKTSGELGLGVWPHLAKGDLMLGTLSVLDVEGRRSLAFEGALNPPGDPFLTGDNEIVRMMKAASGFNIAVNIWIGDQSYSEPVMCIVGPRGRIKTICACLGHPI